MKPPDPRNAAAPATGETEADGQKDDLEGRGNSNATRHSVAVAS